MSILNLPKYLDFLTIWCYYNTSVNTLIKVMKTTILLASLLIAQNALALDDNPTAKFDTSANLTTVSTINWRPVDDVQRACESESRKRGFKGFGHSIQACSFFDGNQCTIITGKFTSMHSLGHEVRHCFQGNWH